MKRALVILMLAQAAYADEPKKEVAAKTDEKSSDPDKPLRTTEMCIDQEIADRLAIKRKRRGAVDRLFVKQGRHELAIGGGYYASDLLSGTYIASGSYTYHMTDETAVEFGGAFTHANADVIRALEDKRGVVLTETYARMIFAESLLVWSPVYGKLRLDRPLRPSRGHRRRRDRFEDEPRSFGRPRLRHETLHGQSGCVSHRRTQSHVPTRAPRRAVPRQRQRDHCKPVAFPAVQ
jgi:hypothetical protein